MNLEGVEACQRVPMNLESLEACREVSVRMGSLEACKRASVSLVSLFEVSHYARFARWRVCASGECRHTQET